MSNKKTFNSLIDNFKNLNIKNDSYSELSKTITKKLNKNTKKKHGIYFTPLETILLNINILKKYITDWNNINILEPSCGSCQFIIELSKLSSNITGIEYVKEIYDSIKNIEIENIKIINDSFITHEINKYDLIIGNPPFYVMKKNDVSSEYYKYFYGRPNIFILFIIKSLKSLNKNGILSFVLPKNFLNCLYYEKTRKYISSNFQILEIINLNDDYLETKQETILFIVKKIEDKVNNKQYILDINNNVIFNFPKNIIKINKLLEKSVSLSDMGFKVSVGNIVWNQKKDILTDDSNQTRLIYNSDISNGKLIMKKYKNESKKNFIKLEGNKGPLLVINRGYGKGNYTFEYCLININKPYLIENHLICIKSINNMKNNELIENYKKIINSLSDKRTLEFINIYFGNNAINTTELNFILPFYI